MMLITRHTVFFPAILLLAGTPTRAGAQAPPRSVTFGVVFDGPADRNEVFSTLIQGAIAQHLGAEVAASFPPEDEIVADWTTDGVQRAIAGLLRDRDVEVILALGAIGSDLAAHWPRPLGKPVVAAIVLDPELQEFPIRDGASGVANLTYVAVPRTIAGDLATFSRVVSFRHLAVLIPQVYDTGIPTLRPNFDRLLVEMGITPNLVPVSASTADVLRRLPRDADAAYIFRLPGLDDADMSRLAEGLRDRGLPSYAAGGPPDVRRGFLFSARPHDPDRLVAHEVADAVARMLHGQTPARVPVYVPRNTRLTVNVVTARAIDAEPPWAVLAEAEEVGAETLDSVPAVTLAGAVREAVAHNLDLAAQDYAVASGAARTRSATAPLLPHVEGTIGASLRNEDQAAVGLGLTPERSLDAGLRLSQSVFSEGRWAAAAIERRRQGAREQVRDQVRLDIILETATAYVEVLRTSAAEEIYRDHLRTALAYQEVAEVREASGSSGAGELARLAAEVAGSRRALVEADGRRRAMTIRLNRLLHRDLEASFAGAATEAEDLHLLLTEPRLESLLRTRSGLRRLRSLMTQEAEVGAPELRRLEAAIAGESRAVGSATRAFFLPDVSLEASLDDRLAAGGAGRVSPIPAVPTPEDLRWSVGLRLSYPIFAGRARGAAKAQAEANLADLETRRDAERERVEERLRTTVLAAGASFAGIDLSREVADAAARNLELVGAAFRLGDATVTNLVESQNAALSAHLAAVDAQYDFLEDALRVERAMGAFSFFATRADRAALLERLEAAR